MRLWPILPVSRSGKVVSPCVRSRLRSQHGRHIPSTFHRRVLLDLRDILKSLDDTGENFTTPLMVSVLAAFELHIELHFVLVRQELASLLDFEFDIVVPGLRTQPDFFQLHLMLLRRLRCLPFLFVLELPVVHDTTDRRPLVRRHLDQIQTRFVRQALRFRSRYDPQHFSFVIDHANGRKSNLFIDTMRGFDCWQLLESGALEPTFASGVHHLRRYSAESGHVEQ